MIPLKSLGILGFQCFGFWGISPLCFMAMLSAVSPSNGTLPVAIS